MIRSLFSKTRTAFQIAFALWMMTPASVQAQSYYATLHNNDAVGAFASLLTTTQQQDIIAAFVGVFNYAPGAHLSTWASFVSSGGTIAQMYDAMASSAQFKSLTFAYSDAATDAQFASGFTANLMGNEVSSANLTLARRTIEGLLAAQITKGAVIKYWVDLLRSTPTTDANWGPAAQRLTNRIAVATDYTFNQGSSTAAVTSLQAVIYSVTTSLASVTDAIASNTGLPTTAWSISTGASPSAGGTVCCNFTGTSRINDFTVTAIANSGYNFTNWTDGGAVVSTSANYSFTFTGPRTLVANFAATTGANSSNAFTITGSVTGSLASQTIIATVQVAPADAGQSIGIYVAANVGNTWIFKGANGGWTPWSGGALPAPFMSVNTVRNSTDSFSVPVVESVDLRSFSGAGIYVGYGKDQADMVSNARYQRVATVSSAPTPNPQAFTLTVNTIGNGTVSVNPSASSYAPGTVVTLIGVPGTGHDFSTWTDSCAGSGAVCTLTMHSSLSATARFVQQSPSIDFSVIGGQAPLNQFRTLTVVSGITGGNGDYRCQVDTFANGTPPFGMTVDSFAYKGTCQIIGTPTQAGTYTFGICVIDTAATQSCKQVTVSVSPAPTTKPITYSLATAIIGSGTISASPPGPSYSSGTVVILTATPSAGSTFGSWSGVCTGTGTCTVTMNASVSVTATFATSSAPSVTIQSATCNKVSTDVFGSNYQIVASGTVSGAVGAVLSVTPNPTLDSPYSVTCGSWTGAAGSYSCTRGASAAATTAWTSQLGGISTGFTFDFVHGEILVSARVRQDAGGGYVNSTSVSATAKCP